MPVQSSNPAHSRKLRRPFNFKQHLEEKFYTCVGLARGYTAAGDKEKAIQNWEIALKNVPETQKAALLRFEKALKDLKESSPSK